MMSQNADSLLLAAGLALTAVSLYAIWLWVKLWIIRQALGGIVVISTNNERSGSQTGGGCSGFLFLLLAIAIVIGSLFFVS